MKTEKLTRLLSALGKPANSQEVQNKNEQSHAQATRRDIDAVSVQLSKQAAQQPTEDAAQREKVARLREQVQNGSYQVDSKKVAAAFLTELGLV